MSLQCSYCHQELDPSHRAIVLTGEDYKLVCCNTCLENFDPGDLNEQDQ